MVALASAAVVLILIVLAGIILAITLTSGPKRSTKISVSASDLAEMKTLAYEYLNERTRLLISSEPDKDPSVAGAPIITPANMSPGLATRQKEDVEKLKARPYPGAFKNFAILSHVLDIQGQGEKIVLHIGQSTYFQLIQRGNPQCSAEGDDRYFTFSRAGGRWILTDVKLPYAGTMPSSIEPSVQPSESGTDRVMANPPKETSVIPEEVKRLDKEAMQKIRNRWAIDDQTAEAIEAGTYSW